MANGNYRVQTEDTGGSFVMGFLTGTLIGAGLGMLFAPKTGADLRRQLGEQADNLANNASDTYRKATQGAGEWVNRAQESAGDWAGKATQAADDLAGRGKELYGKAREAFAKGADEAQRYAREGASAGSVSPFPSTSEAGAGTSPRGGDSSGGASGGNGAFAPGETPGSRRS